MLKNIKEHLINEITELVGKEKSSFVERDILEVHIFKEDLIQIVKFLQNDPKLKFSCLIDLFGIDYPAETKRFEVVYSLLSTKFNYRIILKVKAAEKENIPSLFQQFPNAIWYEREAFDMYGVNFDNNPDMRRILTDYGFEGHPLRKDFPLTGYKEVRYDFEQRKVIYEPVHLVQKFRNFDFLSPWEGTDYKLPGDEKAGEAK